MELNKSLNKDDGWNSDEVAIPGLSCEQSGRYMSAFMSAFRALLIAQSTEGSVGVMKSVRRLLDAQISVIESGVLSDKDQEMAENNAFLGLISIGMAMASSSEVDPRSLADISMQAVNLFDQILTEAGDDKVNKSHLHFSVKKTPGDGNMKVAVALIDMDELNTHLDQDTTSGKVLRLIKSMPKSDGSN